jgi:4-amino-4-deoxy-L-arabinose transferase-like glycosyltransferase
VSQAWRRFDKRAAGVTILILILVLAAYLRLYCLLPMERGLQFLQDYDEGVWDTTAQLMLQGYMPYRDFFATLPPLAIYLLSAVLRLVYVPWGSTVGFMATRYASVVYGLAAVAAVYALGKKLGGRRAGMLPAGLLSLDGMVIGMDRRVMLEPPLNVFSVLAVLAFCSSFQRPQDDHKATRAAILSGLLSALAALVKTPGLVVILALLTVSAVRRRWREAGLVALSFALSCIALSAYFLICCPGDLVKQVYFFQLLRPADGITRLTTRLYDIWHYPSAWLTVRVGLAGAAFAALLSIRRDEARTWWAVLAWTGYTAALIVFNKSYWPQYYVQLAVPLAVLAGALLDQRGSPAWTLGGAHVTLGELALLAILVVGLALGGIGKQWAETLGLVQETSPTYVALADTLRQRTGEAATVLVFEPNYTFLASRPPAGPQPGRFFVDSYGEMLYVNLSIAQKSIPELVQALLFAEEDELQHTFWRPPAQAAVLSAFERAQYVVTDARARYQLHPQTLATIEARSVELSAAGPASLRQPR